jgi:3-hydroxyisobutyrate dehydrogenase-like beta-hydroxyacid dehydrogenase
MRVTIIGAGNMGRGIGTRAVAGGHEVEIVDNDPAEASALADELGGAATATYEVSVGGEVAVLAMYYPATLASAQEYGGSSQARPSSTSRIRSTSRRWTGWPSRLPERDQAPSLAASARGLM